MSKLFLSTPCYGGLTLEAYAGSILMLHRLMEEKGHLLYYDTMENESLIPRARNVSISKFMEMKEYTHFMFIDADVHFEAQAVINLLECPHEVSCAVYPKKCVMWDQAKTAVDKEDDRPMDLVSSSLVVNFGQKKIEVENNFIEVLDAPTGFLMMKRSCLERMYEYYEDTLTCVNDHHSSMGSTYVAIFDCMIDPDSRRYLSEDYAFCRRWQKMGGKIYADVRTTLGHVGNLTFAGSMKERLKN